MQATLVCFVLISPFAWEGPLQKHHDLCSLSSQGILELLHQTQNRWARDQILPKLSPYNLEVIEPYIATMPVFALCQGWQ